MVLKVKCQSQVKHNNNALGRNGVNVDLAGALNHKEQRDELKAITQRKVNEVGGQQPEIEASEAAQRQCKIETNGSDATEDAMARPNANARQTLLP